VERHLLFRRVSAAVGVLCHEEFLLLACWRISSGDSFLSLHKNGYDKLAELLPASGIPLGVFPGNEIGAEMPKIMDRTVFYFGNNLECWGK